MNKKPHKSQIPALLHQIRGLIAEARSTVSRSVDFVQVWTNFHIGRVIVEDEQRGSNRAEYCTETIPILSVKLTQEFGKGFAERNLEYMRQFYRILRVTSSIAFSPC